MMWWWPGGGAGMIGWLALVVIGLAALVLLVAALGRSDRASDVRRRERPEPAEVLDDRLARGEIDVAEYRERRAALDEERQR